MIIKLFHLNIEEGKQQEAIIDYVRKEDFDILQFQEVTGGEHNALGMENFPTIKQALGYGGIQAIYWYLKDDPKTYMSNATFFKSSLHPVSHHVIPLKPEVSPALPREVMKDYPSHPTAALDVLFHFSGLNIHFINTHLVWGPTPDDKPYKLAQGRVLYKYIKGLTEPFILSGDFNVTPDSQIVRWIDELGINHIVKHGITNTLNGNLHRAKELFPKGLAVDFFFTHPSLQVHNFKLIDTPDLSDHYGLVVEIEI
jgi:endonuclease/exonuclease/phosphatase family metal-dependent hydrolase